jgi:hypothetical protein
MGMPMAVVGMICMRMARMRKVVRMVVRFVTVVIVRVRRHRGVVAEREPPFKPGPGGSGAASDRVGRRRLPATAGISYPARTLRGAAEGG